MAKASLDHKITEINDRSIDALAQFSASTRFHLINDIVRSLEEEDDTVNGSVKAGQTPVTDRSARRHSLNRLALSFSHSDTYCAFIENAAEMTVQKTDKDEKLKSWLSHRDVISKRLRRYSTVRIAHHFLQSAGEICGHEFVTPPFRFFKKEMTDDSILQGVFSILKSDTAGVGCISINEHEDAGYMDPVESCGTSIHEAFHAAEAQVAYHHNTGEAPERPFEHDTMLYSMRIDYNATIPYSIGAPYRNQYHERLAYDAERLFLRALKKIL